MKIKEEEEKHTAWKVAVMCKYLRQAQYEQLPTFACSPTTGRKCAAQAQLHPLHFQPGQDPCQERYWTRLYHSHRSLCAFMWTDEPRFETLGQIRGLVESGAKAKEERAKKNAANK